MTQPLVSVVMPVYNTEKYVEASIRSVLAQTFIDFELLVIDDGGDDSAASIARKMQDSRIIVISQKNRGLAGARNTGIRHSKGKYVAFLDSDDLWCSSKLANHVAHLEQNPDVGVSYSGSVLIDEHGYSLKIRQNPKLINIDASDIFLRNPIGNGSAPVIRRQALRDIEYVASSFEKNWFSEDFRQSEDIECWMRLALKSSFRFEGIPGHLTYYRVNEGGLSANVVRQFESWIRVRDKVRVLAPEFAEKWEQKAESYQLRYLARRAIRMVDRGLAIKLVLEAIRLNPSMLLKEPLKTLSTLSGGIAVRVLPERINKAIQSQILRT